MKMFLAVLFTILILIYIFSMFYFALFTIDDFIIDLTKTQSFKKSFRYKHLIIFILYPSITILFVLVAIIAFIKMLYDKSPMKDNLTKILNKQIFKNKKGD